MMSISRLYIVRHGETDWNLIGRVQGHTPTFLNETGRRQAELLSRFFAACPLTEILSSDLPRARETAELIAAPHGLAVRQTEALRERNLGPFEGKMGDEVRATADFTSWYEVYGVEQDEAMLARLLPLLDEAEAEAAAGEVVFVTHGGVQKVLFHHILGIPLERKRGFTLTNGQVIVFRHEEVWRLEGLYALEMLVRILG